MKLAAHHDVKTYGLRSDAGYMNLEDATVSMMYMDRTGMELYKVKLKEGQLPQKENDIVVSKGILEALGQNGKIGDTITVPYQILKDDGLDYKMCIRDRNGTYFCSGRKAGKAHTEEAGKRASDAGCDN